MNTIVSVKHQDISFELLKSVCEVKSLSWPYPLESQLSWIDNNLSKDDVHFILTGSSEIKAYANLINIKISLDGLQQKGIGIGNVCAKIKGNGLGSTLMAEINEYITLNKKIGLLFCRPELVKFYQNNGWILIKKEKLNLIFDNQYIETLILNSNVEFNTLEYLGKSF